MKMEAKFWNTQGYYEVVALDVVSVLSEKAVRGTEYCPREGKHSGWVVPDGMELYYEEAEGYPVLVVIDLEQVSNYDRDWVYAHFPVQMEQFNPMWVAFKRYFAKGKEAATEQVVAE